MALTSLPLFLPLIALCDCMRGTEDSSALVTLTVSSWVTGRGDWDAESEGVGTSSTEEDEEEEEDDEEEEEDKEEEEDEEEDVRFPVFCSSVVRPCPSLLSSSPNPVRQLTLRWNVTKEHRSFGFPIN